MLTSDDLHQIEEKGIHIDKIKRQLEIFTRGIPFVEVVTAASISNGIVVIKTKECQELIDIFEGTKSSLDLVKFVPASGAATRMFSFLHNFLETYNPEEKILKSYLKETDNKELATFLSSRKEFAFVSSLRKKIRKNYPEYRHGSKGVRTYLFVSLMLNEKGMNFNNLPKGLIPFHKYSKYSTTAFEEQLYEAAFYAAAENEVFLHFTFSEKHLPYFKEEFEDVQNRVSKKTKTNFNISYSFQKDETDTIAVTPYNQPFRDTEGKLVFRPSGHGALLENLNDVDADIVFIKNIDNVVTEELAEEIAIYKKMLAGKLLSLQKKIFNYLELLLTDSFDGETLKQIKSFLWNELNIKKSPDSIDGIVGLLNRPIRVCGVVRNTGAPGGGPFWVKNKSGDSTLQIVEVSQIDLENPRQNFIVNEATHFNPVDIVCGVRDYMGKKFDLQEFSDLDSGFISLKTENGEPVKALELPGLWNGGMAYWNTVFVEVPLITFNPVKTINDLLTKEHRPNL